MRKRNTREDADKDSKDRDAIIEAGRKLRRAKARESGSDELRGANQDAQIRAMMAKDPEGAPRTGERTKSGKRLGGHYG